ncbi:MAG: ChbG/HpnK family deacetylase [Nitrospirota bacterium]|nr:ChbG/HpnK family deacetylase [Nitrospirota bacterium]
MKWLIVNADDFGISEHVNEGILRAHQAGAITNATLMIRRPCASRAVSYALKHPSLCVGLHLDLDHLLGRDETGAERFGMERLSLMLADRKFFRDVEQEVDNQIKAFLESGLPLTHIDGHHHLHALPDLFPMIVDRMVKHGIRTIRFSRSFDLVKYPPIEWDEGFYREMEALLKRHKIRYADHFVTGWQPYDLTSIGDGVTELMTHPATREEWRVRELETLTDESWREGIKAHGIQLASFGDLGDGALG